MQIDDRDARQWYNALAELVAGHTSEQVADILQQGGFHSDKNPATVASHVRGSLNINRPEFFKISELVYLMRVLDHLEPLEWMLAQVGCKPPQRNDGPPDSPEVLQQRRQSLVDELGLVETKLSQLTGSSSSSGRRKTVLFAQEA